MAFSSVSVVSNSLRLRVARFTEDAGVVAGDIGAAAPASNEQTASCCGCCEVRA